MQRRERRQLCADLRGRMDQEPVTFAVGHGDGRLFARQSSNGACSHAGAIRAAAVPLRKSTARRRPQDMNLHAGSCLVRLGLRRLTPTYGVVRPRSTLVEVVLIASDFRAHVDFCIGGRRPCLHEIPSLTGLGLSPIAMAVSYAMEYLIILTKTLAAEEWHLSFLSCHPPPQRCCERLHAVRTRPLRAMLLAAARRPWRIPSLVW